MPETPDYSSNRENLSATDQRIRDLNDRFRRSFEGGQVMMTKGVANLALQVRYQVFSAIQTFDDFTEDNDPYGTREFGSVEIDGQTVWFKIDAYDRNLEYGSPDPSDPEVTTRVMTVLLPEEY